MLARMNGNLLPIAKASACIRPPHRKVIARIPLRCSRDKHVTMSFPR
jgi:hypothetical protein